MHSIARTDVLVKRYPKRFPKSADLNSQVSDRPCLFVATRLQLGLKSLQAGQRGGRQIMPTYELSMKVRELAIRDRGYRSWAGTMAALVIAVLFSVASVSCAGQKQQTEEMPSPTPVVRAARPTFTPTPLREPTAPATATPTALQEAVSPEPTATPNSPPVRLVIPALGIDTPVVEVAWQIVGQGDQRRSEWQTAENAAGHHVNSANPGQSGNVVISGHHNTKGKVFEQISRDVDRREPRLKPGSEIYVYAADGHRYVYEVEQVLLLPEVGASGEERRQNARWMAPTDQPTLTLITCWPMWTNTHRVIVRARLNAEKSAASPPGES